MNYHRTRAKSINLLLRLQMLRMRWTIIANRVRGIEGDRVRHALFLLETYQERPKLLRIVLERCTRNNPDSLLYERCLHDLNEEIDTYERIYDHSATAVK